MRFILPLLMLLLLACKNDTKAGAKADLQAEAQQMDLEIYDFDGLKKFLNITSNKTYVVNFWATWCAPCVKELPYFEDLNTQYKNEQVEVILVSLDFPKTYETSLKPFLKEKKLQTKVVALDDANFNSWIPQVHPDWSGAIPATLIYNREKRKFFEKSFTYKELENEVKQFIK